MWKAGLRPGPSCGSVVRCVLGRGHRAGQLVSTDCPSVAPRGPLWLPGKGLRALSLAALLTGGHYISCSALQDLAFAPSLPPMTHLLKDSFLKESKTTTLTQISKNEHAKDFVLLL